MEVFNRFASTNELLCEEGARYPVPASTRSAPIFLLSKSELQLLAPMGLVPITLLLYPSSIFFSSFSSLVPSTGHIFLYFYLWSLFQIFFLSAVYTHQG